MNAYKAITATSIEELNKRANELLCNGWVPVGGVSVILGPCGNYVRYSQAFGLS